jgi:hypothetical protein
LLFGDHWMFQIKDKSPPTQLAARVLLPGMNMTISLVPG